MQTGGDDGPKGTGAFKRQYPEHRQFLRNPAVFRCTKGQNSLRSWHLSFCASENRRDFRKIAPFRTFSRLKAPVPFGPSSPPVCILPVRCRCRPLSQMALFHSTKGKGIGGWQQGETSGDLWIRILPVEYWKRKKTLETKVFGSDRRGSNPRPPPWQGGVLPTVLLSHTVRLATNNMIIPNAFRFVNLFLHFHKPTYHAENQGKRQRGHTIHRIFAAQKKG